MKTCLALRRIINNSTYRSICSLAEWDSRLTDIPTFSATLQILGQDCKTIPNVDNSLDIGEPNQQGKYTRTTHIRGPRKAGNAAPGLHVSGTASFTPNPAPSLQRQFHAHAAPLEEEEKRENPGFIAGNYNVEQFPPNLVHAPPMECNDRWIMMQRN